MARVHPYTKGVASYRKVCERELVLIFTNTTHYHSPGTLPETRAMRGGVDKKRVTSFFTGASALRSFIKTLWPASGLEAYDAYASFANNLVRNKGSVNAIGILKDINSAARLYILGRKTTSNKFGGVWLKRNYQGLPRGLNPLWALIPAHPRLVLFVCNMVYTLRCKPNTDISTVEQPATNDRWKSWKDSYETFVASHIPEIRKVTLTNRLHFSLKSGPLGPGSIVQSGLELLLFQKLHKVEWFRDLCTAVGHEDLLKRFDGGIHWINSGMVDIAAALQSKSLKRAESLANLAFLASFAGKTRIVYILSWWLQELLYPLHVSAMSWLKLQRQDATFNQSGALKDLMKWTSLEEKDIYSFDLTAATDRWPREHQFIAFKAMFGLPWAQTWLTIMELQPYCKAHKRLVRYSVGQPMGAYASWAALAVSHHLLIRYAAFLIDDQDPKYWVLGDDVLIKGHTLASKYQELIGDMGLSISLKKSILPMEGLPSSGEFAKHIVTSGIDYTPVSPNLVNEVLRDHQWWKLSELLIDMARHYGLHLIAFNEGSVTESVILESLLSRLSKISKAKALIALTNPETGLPHLETIQPRVIKDPHKLGLPDCGEAFEDSLIVMKEELPSPWEGVISLEFLTYKLELVEAAMQRALQSQYKLREGLRETSCLSFSPKSRDMLLALPHHPIWICVENLQQVILAGEYQLAHGDLPPGTGDLSKALVDAEQLYRWLVLNKTKDVTTYDRQAYYKEKRLRIIELHNLIKGVNQPPCSHEGYDDWT